MTDSYTNAPAPPAATPRILGMRDAFFEALFEIFKSDPKCVLISADNGAPTMDRFVRELPRQFVQVGIAEQQMIGMASGLAIEGRRVWCYAIAPFVTTRVHEFVKLDACAANLPITLLGVGAGYAYDTMSVSHHTVEDISIMRVLPNLTIWSPADSATARGLARASYELKGPGYIRFDRTGLPELPSASIGDGARTWLFDLRHGSFTHRRRVVILATGVMTHTAIEVARMLSLDGVCTTVVDIARIKPPPRAEITAYAASRVVTLEEHLLAGGLGSLVLETLNDAGVHVPVLRIGVPDCYTFEYGGREAIWEKYGLTAPQVAQRIAEWLR